MCVCLRVWSVESFVFFLSTKFNLHFSFCDFFLFVFDCIVLSPRLKRIPSSFYARSALVKQEKYLFVNLENFIKSLALKLLLSYIFYIKSTTLSIMKYFDAESKSQWRKKEEENLGKRITEN